MNHEHHDNVKHSPDFIDRDSLARYPSNNNDDERMSENRSSSYPNFAKSDRRKNFLRAVQGRLQHEAVWFTKTHPLFQAQGIAVRLHAMSMSPIIFAGFIGFCFGPAEMVYAVSVHGPLLFLIACFHELGHIAVVRWMGGQANVVVLWPLGGFLSIQYGSIPLTAKQEIMVSLGGALSHVPLLVFFGVLLLLTEDGLESFDTSYDDVSHNFLQRLLSAGLAVNVFLLGCNLLLPAYPLDGGRLFVNVMTLMGWHDSWILYWSAMVSGVQALLLTAMGGYLFLQANLLAVLLLFTAAWMALHTYQLVSMQKMGCGDVHPLFEKPDMDHTAVRSLSFTESTGTPRESIMNRDSQLKDNMLLSDLSTRNRAELMNSFTHQHTSPAPSVTHSQRASIRNSIDSDITAVTDAVFHRDAAYLRSSQENNPDRFFPKRK